MSNRYNLLSDVYEFALSGHADAFAASFCRYLVRTAQRRSVPTLFTGREAQDESSRGFPDETSASTLSTESQATVGGRKGAA